MAPVHYLLKIPPPGHHNPRHSPEILSFLLLPLLLLLFNCCCCCCRILGLESDCPFGDTVPRGTDTESAEEVATPDVITGLLFGDKSPATLELLTTVSSLAAFGPTVITVGRTSVRANVEPGSGSLYGGGLLALIVAVIGVSAREIDYQLSQRLGERILGTLTVVDRGIRLVLGQATTLPSPFRRWKLFVWQL